MMELSKKATQKGLCVGCGNQRRHAEHYQDIIKRVQDGEIGEIVSAQCYWNGAYYVGGWKGFEDLGFDTMEYQIRKWSSFIWPSGDHIVEQHVHNLDVIMWALGDKRFPKEVRAWGGRSADPDLPYPHFGDRFSHFIVDFDMGEGLRLQSYCQQERKTSGEVGERIIGTKGIMYTTGGCKLTDLKGNITYINKKPALNAYVAEHKYLLNAIRTGQRVNRLDELIGSTMLAIAGRMSAYSGQKFKYGWVLAKSKESLAPKEWKFGKYPLTGVPVPGKFKLV
jgi:predicted dehydrogenase